SDAYRRELVAQNKLWPQKYGFLVDEYRKMNEQMDKGKPLPVKALRVKEEDFRRFQFRILTKNSKWVATGTNWNNSLSLCCCFVVGEYWFAATKTFQVEI
ncbi:hypothetical protein RRG08_059700, partial [Elysia crispata]